ncbi:hypothetical protein CPB84DRAFT_1746642 [Gymnopilus junonius]|uniref:Uncharacterized protein n=1 Tax=Gymnopilus junonius TaxID=109634 RepID=A0A9P5NMP6_GYMJU|nr:hypothetical protein CPB84DRAFT_1746642 [Gymnopilus junonius]
MSDTASIRSRASAMLNRPQIVPMGPRTRQSSRTSMRASHIPEDVMTPQSTSLDLPEFGGQSSTSSPASMSPSSSRHKSLPQLAEVLEEPTSPDVAPAYEQREEEPAEEVSVIFSSQVTEEPMQLVARHEPLESPASPYAHLDLPSDPPTPAQFDPSYSVQPPSQPATLAPTNADAPVPLPLDSAAPVKIIPVNVSVPKFTPPAAIKFESAPVEYKALSYEAALWTIDSAELQGMVSRAIRSSASTSFIRLLSEENIDKVLPVELERLDTLKAVTQSKYRFLVQRRTMLFQALNSTSLSQQKDGEDGVSVVSRLTLQLADTVAECDKNLEHVLQISDQISQINKLIEVHWSSSLSIALRKLNGSYARRVSDLGAAKERITQLEAELGDAWKEAERLAKELDEYETALVADDVEAVIETAEIVTVPKTTPPAHQRRSSIPLTPTLLAFAPSPSTTPMGPLSPVSPPSHSNYVFLPVHLKAKETDVEDVPDTVSIKSTRSTRSTKSAKSHRSQWSESNTHSAGIQAAKTRSHRRSQSSLRLNIGHSRKQSNGRARTPYEEHPPVPELPIQFSVFNTITSAGSANASSILLHSTDCHAAPHRPHRRANSFDSVITSASRITTAQAQTYRGKAAAADDLYVRMQKQYLHQLGLVPSEDIQVMPRTQPTTAHTFASMYEKEGFMTPRPPPKDPSKKGIPSMWMNVDAPKPTSNQAQPTAEPSSSSPISVVPSSPSHTLPPQSPISFGSGSEAAPSSYSSSTTNRRSSTTRNTYDKIRGLTKRYSVSLPLLFTSQPRSTSRRSG